jgi:hypothetical protein
MPSKLFTYALSGKPILATLHRGSPAYRLFQEESSLGRAIWFEGTGEMPADSATMTLRAFIADAVRGATVDRQSIVEPYTSETMARRHAALFEACCESEDACTG